MSAKSSSSVMATSTLRRGCDRESVTRGPVCPLCQGCGLMMSFLTSLPAWLLVLGSIVFTLLVAASGRLVARKLVPEDEYDHVVVIAAPLMPALGALFAVLIAVTVASEAGYLKTAQESVANEASAASRVAWPRRMLGSIRRRSRLPSATTCSR